jgi:cellobiose epimerase
MKADPAHTPDVARGAPEASAWAGRIEAELRGNILPFWAMATPDPVNGGFYGAVTNDLQILNDAPRSAVLYGRILWTFSAAYRLYVEDTYLAVARRALEYITAHFVDPDYGGVYWAVDQQGRPFNSRKHAYAQAFVIYGLAEYYRATGDAGSLSLSLDLYRLTETHTHDEDHGGNIECRDRDWGPLADMRLSAIDANSHKSMNTLLHLIEAYANLAQACDDTALPASLRGLLVAFLDHVIDPDTQHLRLFFDDGWNWRHLGEGCSYGHDIEASWLLVEAAEALGDAELIGRAREQAVTIAQAVYTEALEPDGSLLYESAGHGPQTHGPRAMEKHWWAHAEAVVGFYNAYQLTGEARFEKAAQGCWDYIEARFVDRTYGDWFKVLDRGGVPLPGQVKVGPWECPYHHSRACFEMLARLGARRT